LNPTADTGKYFIIQSYPIYSVVENRERTSSSTVNTSTEQETTDKTLKGQLSYSSVRYYFSNLVIEERNKYAVEICKRIRDKLDGSDPDPLTQSSISEQVRKGKTFLRIRIEFLRLGSLYHS
jgi:chromosomal replication initiation ATPase DnaA